MRRPLLALALLLTPACQAWTPEALPAQLSFAESATDEQRASVARVAAELERAAGRQVVEVVARCEGACIVVHAGESDLPKASSGQAVSAHDGCRLELVGRVNDRITMHELLHCYGLEHDELDDSVMRSRPGHKVLGAHVDQLLDR